MSRALPLSGVRVVDFTWAWAGPWCTTLLADMGAEVIKVESRLRPDAHRILPTWADDVPGLNRAGLFNNYNRNKLAITLNLAEPEGRDLARQLIFASDIVAENFSPRVMAALGLDYACLSTAKPDLVMVSLSGYGHSGPYRLFPAYGDSMWAFSGSGLLTGFPGGTPEMPGTPLSDPIVGVHAAVAVLAALHHRRRTGKGQYVDVTQLECILATIPEAVTDYAFNGRQPELHGNRHPAYAPHDCYRCAGDDEWLAIAVTTDAEWRALCRLMGDPGLARVARFATFMARRRHHDELDELIDAWTRQASARERFLALQEAGVPCAPVLKVPELVADPHLGTRGFWPTVDHPEVGTRTVQGLTWHMSRTPGTVSRPAPCIGEHNQFVLGEILGVHVEHLRELELAGILS